MAVRYFSIVLVKAAASLSAGTGGWHAQSPNAAAMNRTLAKFTGFMGPHSTSRHVIDEPERDGSYGA
jgi:hypothetical protein